MSSIPCPGLAQRVREQGSTPAGAGDHPRRGAEGAGAEPARSPEASGERKRSPEGGRAMDRTCRRRAEVGAGGRDEPRAAHAGLGRLVVRRQQRGRLSFADALHEGRLGRWPTASSPSRPAAGAAVRRPPCPPPDGVPPDRAPPERPRRPPPPARRPAPPPAGSTTAARRRHPPAPLGPRQPLRTLHPAAAPCRPRSPLLLPPPAHQPRAKRRSTTGPGQPRCHPLHKPDGCSKLTPSSAAHILVGERRRTLPCPRPDMTNWFYYFSGGTTELLVTQ